MESDRIFSWAENEEGVMVHVDNVLRGDDCGCTCPRCHEKLLARHGEVKKQKIKLSLVQQDEWEDYFTQYQTTCQELAQQIAATDSEIDNRVFDLYGLTPEERDIVMTA